MEYKCAGILLFKSKAAERGPAITRTTLGQKPLLSISQAVKITMGWHNPPLVTHQQAQKKWELDYSSLVYYFVMRKQKSTEAEQGSRVMQPAKLLSRQTLSPLSPNPLYQQAFKEWEDLRTKADISDFSVHQSHPGALLKQDRSSGSPFNTKAPVPLRLNTVAEEASDHLPMSPSSASLSALSTTLGFPSHLNNSY